MPWSTMAVSRYGQRWIGHIALYVPQLCVTLLVDRRLHRYELTHIWSHAPSHSSCFQFYVLLLNVHPGSYFRWLQLQRCGGITGVWCCCVSPGGALVEAPVVRLDLALIAPGCSISGPITGCCEMVRKMITKRSGKSWRLYSYLQVKMEQVTAN